MGIISMVVRNDDSVETWGVWDVDGKFSVMSWVDADRQEPKG